MLDVIDHTNHPSWTPKNLRLGRENGAKTYSVDIVRFYVPVFQRFFNGDEKVLLIVVQNWDSCEYWGGYDKIFVFVHERGIDKKTRLRKLEALKRFAQINKHAEVWFIAWCPQHEKEILDFGLNGLYLPMGIDSERYLPYQKVKKFKQQKIIYYGNIVYGKRMPFIKLKNLLHKRGWILDCISCNKFNGKGETLTQEECRKILSKYRYGVAVGRSAQELSAMGLKVFCYAYGDGMFPDSVEKAKILMAQNNTSWGEGLSLRDFNKVLSIENLEELKPIYQDCREISGLLEKKLTDIFEV